MSSCPEGTVFTGLNYVKAKSDPVALADKEYPEWLWKCLEVTVKRTEEGNADAEAEFCTFLRPLLLPQSATNEHVVQPNQRNSAD